MGMPRVIACPLLSQPGWGELETFAGGGCLAVLRRKSDCKSRIHARLVHLLTILGKIQPPTPYEYIGAKQLDVKGDRRGG